MGVLFISSLYLETEYYRNRLSENGYYVDGAENVVNALPKLDTAYDAILFDPYFLSFGDHTKKGFPSGVDLEDPLSLGLWFYDKIREGKNSRSQLFLIPLRLREERLMILKTRMKQDSGNVHLCDLLETLPSKLCDLMNKTLRK